MCIMDAVMLCMAYVFGKETADIAFRSYWERMLLADFHTLGFDVTLLYQPVPPHAERQLREMLEGIRQGDAAMLARACFYMEMMQQASMQN